MTEVKSCLVEINPNVVCCIAPEWQAAKLAVKVCCSRVGQAEVSRIGSAIPNDSRPSACTKEYLPNACSKPQPLHVSAAPGGRVTMM